MNATRNVVRMVTREENVKGLRKEDENSCGHDSENEDQSRDHSAK
jgi:hypothetical protein